MAKRIKVFPSPNLNTNLSLELLGQAVRAKRTQSQLRLEDAAAFCGVSKQTFSNVESGKGTTQISLVLQICFGLGIQLRILPWDADNEAHDDWT